MDKAFSIQINDITCARAEEYFDVARALPYGATFDSSPGFGLRSRFSYACADPFLVLLYRKGCVSRIITRSGDKHEFHDPFNALRDLLGALRKDRQNAPTPFTIGAAGYFSYDLGRSIERLGAGPNDDLETPDLCLAFYDHTVAIDRAFEKAWLYTGKGFQENPPQPWWDKAIGAEAFTDPAPACGEFRSSFTRPDYIKAVLRAKEYIAAGDIYQVNLSQRFHTPWNLRPQELYRRLRQVNPAPYGCFLNFGDHIVAGASPEEFMTYDASSRRVRTSPIKGTRPRGKTIEEDERLKTELYASEKDRAENVMIVDLERNDLGKVCNYGSISVTDLYGIETHPTVHHLVSVVEGTLHEKRDLVDLIKATFPGGSITGAPKVRSMQIIDELEPVRRGIYTGSAGYISFDGNMSLNILIRSFMLHKNMAYFHAGGGIVADSYPESEYQETLDKVAGLMKTLRADE